MKQIIEHYGSAIIVFVTLIALIGVTVGVVKSEPVKTAFSNVVTEFMADAEAEAKK